MMALWMKKIRRLPDDYDDEQLFGTPPKNDVDGDGDEYTNDYWLPDGDLTNPDGGNDGDWLPLEGDIRPFDDEDDEDDY